MSKTLFVAWQDPERRRWYPIGRLTSSDRRFLFLYVKGALNAEREAGFTPLAAFPDFRTGYRSDHLFPLFTNRLLPVSRPEYGQFLEWLSLPETEADPVAILARSGGQRVTDTLEVFPCPDRLPTGEYKLHFLVHGLSHMPPESRERVGTLQPGDQLLLMADLQNPHDSHAFALRTNETNPGDMHLIGYCPRYLSADLSKLLNLNHSQPVVTVERVNHAPAPVQFRILCRLIARWAEDFVPFSGSEYQPVMRMNGRKHAQPEAA